MQSSFIKAKCLAVLVHIHDVFFCYVNLFDKNSTSCHVMQINMVHAKNFCCNYARLLAVVTQIYIKFTVVMQIHMVYA